ncbi:MAG: hypothetical protein R3D60_13530 [Paracoccaceae bacterium]
MPRTTALCLLPALALAMSLAGCGGVVAPDAPALLSTAELAQRQGTAYSGGSAAQSAGALALRGRRCAPARPRCVAT